MPARINHNAHLKGVHRNLAVHSANVSKRIEQLSSGHRINRSSDDPASLALANGITSERRAIDEGSRNIQQTFALLQVSDGSLMEIGAMVRRMQSLAMEASSTVFNDQDRLSIDNEFGELISEIDRIAGATMYNGKNLLTGAITRVGTESTAVTDNAQTGLSRVRLTGADTGVFVFADEPGDGKITLGNGIATQTVTFDTSADGTVAEPGTGRVVRFRRLNIEVTLAGEGNPDTGAYRDGALDGKTVVVEGINELSFQVGPSETSNDVNKLLISDMRASGPTLNLGDLSIVTRQDAQRALDRLRKSLEAVVSERNRIGAFQNRLELSLETSSSAAERMQATESNIRDADVASTVTQLSKSQIMSQVATRVAVEADADIERILRLLR